MTFNRIVERFIFVDGKINNNSMGVPALTGGLADGRCKSLWRRVKEADQ